MLRMRGVMIRHARDLQSVEIDFLVLQIADSTLPNGVQVLSLAAEQLVVPSYKKGPKRRSQESQRSYNFGSVYIGPVKEITSEKNNVGMKSGNFANDPR